MQTNTPLYFKQIKTIADFDALITFLHSIGKLYHCEDDATDIGTGPLDDWKLTFTKPEGVALNLRMVEAYELDWDGNADGCPCGVAIRVGNL